MRQCRQCKLTLTLIWWYDFIVIFLSLRIRLTLYTSIFYVYYNFIGLFTHSNFPALFMVSRQKKTHRTRSIRILFILAVLLRFYILYKFCVEVDFLCMSLTKTLAVWQWCCKLVYVYKLRGSVSGQIQSHWKKKMLQEFIILLTVLLLLICTRCDTIH